jgi:hypothetical protein
MKKAPATTTRTPTTIRTITIGGNPFLAVAIRYIKHNHLEDFLSRDQI